MSVCNCLVRSGIIYIPNDGETLMWKKESRDHVTWSRFVCLFANVRILPVFPCPSVPPRVPPVLEPISYFPLASRIQTVCATHPPRPQPRR